MNQKRWDEVYGEVKAEMVQWRDKNQKATFNKIEEMVDENLSKLRREILEGLVMNSQQVNISQLPAEKRAECPVCNKALVSNGQQKRKLITTYNHKIEIERSQGKCPECSGTFFPSRRGVSLSSRQIHTQNTRKYGKMGEQTTI